MRVRVLTPFPFDLSRDDGGLVLLCLALSALWIYVPCRWNYRKISSPSDRSVEKYLPYLYLLFCLSLPAQIFKNYQYYEYAHQHGGYTLLFASHSDIAASVPFVVRAFQTITLPVFMAIAVIERKRTLLYLTTALYFISASLVLLLGSRGGIFALILTLWYVGRIKSEKPSHFITIAGLAAMLILLGGIVQNIRESDDASTYEFAPIEFVGLQGNSLDVTAVAVKYHDLLARNVGSYLWNDLQDAFVTRDPRNYTWGETLSDVGVLLNPRAFANGYGAAGSYLAELYLLGGLAGVVLVSCLIGEGIRLMYLLSSKPLPLVFVALIMPDVLLMPRGQLLNWLSVLLRYIAIAVVLWLGWLVYEFCIVLRPGARANSQMAV